MRTAVIAGGGPLPGLLVEGLARSGTPFVVAAPAGVTLSLPGEREVLRFAVERLVPLFDRLHSEGVERVILAGAMGRPALDPESFDARTAALLPDLMRAMQAGDDATLGAVIALFEEAGFEVAGAEAVRPDLLAGAGHLAGPVPSEADLADVARGSEVVSALGAADIGQGAVIAQGLCLAVETVPGTDAMLDWVGSVAGAHRPDPGGARGVVYKAPKPEQDGRADRPAIGPETVRGAARAGLAGVAVAAGGVLLLDRAGIAAEAERAGLFVWGHA